MFTNPAVRSDGPNAGIEASRRPIYASMKELRTRLFALGWGLAVLVATGGWIYLIVQVGRLFVNWLVKWAT